MNSIEQINQKICANLGVNYDDFMKMKLSEQSEVIKRHTKEVLKLKFKNHK